VSIFTNRDDCYEIYYVAGEVDPSDTYYYTCSIFFEDDFDTPSKHFDSATGVVLYTLKELQKTNSFIVDID
jgi:hypothetical protein